MIQSISYKELIKKYGKLFLFFGVPLLMIMGCGILSSLSSLPVANAGPDQNVSTGSIVALNGSGSSSRTGSPLTFEWTQTQGTSVTLTGADTSNPIFIAPAQAETLTFQLVVSDTNGSSIPDTVTIRVGEPTSESPVANAGPDQNVQAGDTVTLNGSGSTSRTGSPLTFAWTQTQGTPVILTGTNTATPTFTAPDLAGTMTFQLVVSDVNGMSAPDTVAIRVIEPSPTSQAPTANAGFNQNVQAGATVTLNGSGSTSLTGSPLTFAWTQTGGTPVTLTGANTANPTFTAPNQADTLTFQLVVRDVNGTSAPDTVTVRVTTSPAASIIHKTIDNTTLSLGAMVMQNRNIASKQTITKDLKKDS